MKRTATAIAAAALVCAACGKSESDKSSDQAGNKPDPQAKAAVAPEQPPEKPPEKPPAPGSVISEKDGVITVREAGFKTPEAILYDDAEDVYLVSNINGPPGEADDNGFISRVAADGKIVALTWIDGASDDVTLHAPKGMALTADTLWVSDLTAVRMFDRKTGAPKGEVEIPGATFMNDLAAFGEIVYASDSGMTPALEPSGTDAIWKIEGGKPTRVLADKGLGMPNGLLADEGGVWVVTFGSGEMYRVDIEGNKGNKGKAHEPAGQLDGLVLLPDGKVLISSWTDKAILAGAPTGPFEKLIADVEAPADIGYDSKRNRVLIPLFTNDELQFHPVAE